MHVIHPKVAKYRRKALIKLAVLAQFGNSEPSKSKTSHYTTSAEMLYSASVYCGK